MTDYTQLIERLRSRSRQGTMMMYEIFGEIDDAPTIVPAEAERSET